MGSSTGGMPPGWSAGQPESLSRPEMDRLWLRRLGAAEDTGLLLKPPAPPEAFQQAVAEFNDGRYWEAHETLEGIWMQCPYPLRLFYYSLIKLSVGLLHLGRHNSVGARQQLAGAAEFFAPFAPRLPWRARGGPSRRSHGPVGASGYALLGGDRRAAKAAHPACGSSSRVRGAEARSA